jgi:N-acetyl-anhydromuramyl-L-alanine amidase AmpD
MSYTVYVIRLRADILQHKKIRDANPNHQPHKPCVYVGYTGLTPERRYQRHIEPGSKVGSKWVKLYHLHLHKRLTEKQPQFETQDEAKAHEAALAERLRRKGYAVWCR